jgi:hypothetical protein
MNENHLRQKGFHWILNKTNLIGKVNDNMNEVILKKHPFGLPLFKFPYSNDRSMPIHFVKPGGGHLVVDNFAILIARELFLYLDHKLDAIRSLRVANAQSNYQHPSHHRVYYEVATYEKAYMSGEATDFSGHGGDCKKHLDAMFIFISELCKIPIETHEIAYPLAEDGMKWLQRKKLEYYIEKKKLSGLGD